MKLFKNVLSGTLALVARIGVNPDDSPELRLQKLLMVMISCLINLACFIWITIYFAYSEVAAAMIPSVYVAISIVSLIIFGRTHNFGFYRSSQLGLILFLPFLLLIVLGGLVSSSAVILWSLLCPLGALVFADSRQARYWFFLFVILVAFSGAFEASMRFDNNLPATMITLFFVMNIVTISGIAFMGLYYFVAEKDKAFWLLQTEQKKAENLLLNILPEEIAAILKNENRVIADHVDEATVLFADVVGFTPLSATMSAGEVVELLNGVFSYFDTLVEKYDLEKIKTIGDAYMVAAGVPRSRPDHAHAMARMALEMLNCPAQMNGHKLSFRIGINSGSLVAGVIGQKKFIYDLWGDAVNTASRMESHGVADKIQITKATYDLIHNDFICEPLGAVTIKGKGEMDVWQLVRENRSTLA